MIKKLLAGVLIWFLIFENGVFAQNILWQNTIGGNNHDQVRCIQQTMDMGYILCGFSDSNISGDKTENCLGDIDIWIVKINSTGNIQWQNTIGGSDEDYANYIQQTVDKGYIVGGTSESNISGDKTENSMGLADYWIIKLDSNGVIQWQNTIGGSDREGLNSVQQTTDKGYILGGWSASGISGDKTQPNWDIICNPICSSDYWIVKIDSIGNIQWQSTIGGNVGEGLNSIQQTNDGGYIAGGFSYSNISGDKIENSLGGSDYWVVKIDSLGNIQWQNTIGGSEMEYLYSISQTNDGGYICGGYSLSGITGDKTEANWDLSLITPDYWIIKIDSIGNILWQKTIGGNADDELYYIQQTFDGGYFLGGSSNSNISGNKTENSLGDFDLWLLKLNSIGNIQWQNTIGGNNYDDLRSVVQALDGGYLLGGFSSSNISGDKSENSLGSVDYWIIKINDTTNTTSITNILHQNEIFISPNPATDKINISFPATTDESVTIKIYSITGEVVFAEENKSIAPITNYQLPVTNFTNGIYFLSVQTGREVVTKKIVVNHKR